MSVSEEFSTDKVVKNKVIIFEKKRRWKQQLRGSVVTNLNSRIRIVNVFIVFINLDQISFFLEIWVQEAPNGVNHGILCI